MNTENFVRDNFITMYLDVVCEARKGCSPILADIEFALPKSNRVKNSAIPKWGYDVNVYMKIHNTNMILLHVKNNCCVVIPNEIVNVNGELIQVAERLSKYYFTIDKVNNEVICFIDKKKIKLYRMLYALVLYGDELRRIPRQLEVHHKWMRYLNIMECMTLLSKNEHKKVHDKTSMASHRLGRLVRDSDDFKAFVKELKNNIEFWKKREY